MISLKHLIYLLVFWGLLLADAGAEPAIFVVRHAEREVAPAVGGDSNLSDVGRARAESLAKTLKDAGVAAVYATEFKRTQETAAPMAKAAGVNVTVIPAGDVATLAEKLRAEHRNALVVGHSNTVPEILKALGISTPVSLGESDYDNLFVVILNPAPHVLWLHYF